VIQRFFASIVVVCCCLFAAGCASPSYAVLMPSPDGSVGAIVVSTAKGTVLLNKKQQAVLMDGSTITPFDASEKKIQTDFASALATQPDLPVHFLVYFKTGVASMTPESEAFIPLVIKAIRNRGAAAVSVIGHTDTAGEPGANEQLGLLRAQAIAQLLKQKGVRAIEITVASHGERNLLVKTPDNVPEPKNRRVEISVR
jgi:outer membrane protein OmpA-like peptidoglycan-associated protein